MAWYKTHTLRVAQGVLAPLALFYSWNMIATGLFITGHIPVPQNILTGLFPLIATTQGISGLFALLLVVAQGVFLLSLPLVFSRSKR